MRNKKENLKKKRQNSFTSLLFSSKFSVHNKYERKLVLVIFGFSFFILRRIERIDGKKLDFSFLFMKKNKKGDQNEKKTRKSSFFSFFFISNFKEETESNFFFFLFFLSSCWEITQMQTPFSSSIFSKNRIKKERNASFSLSSSS